MKEARHKNPTYCDFICIKGLEKANETLRRTLHLLCDIFAPNAKSECNHQETGDKTKLRSIPTNNCPVFLKKDVKAMKDKGQNTIPDRRRLKKCKNEMQCMTFKWGGWGEGR